MIWAYDIRNGAPLWSHDERRESSIAGIVAVGDSLYVVSTEGVERYNSRTGFSEGLSPRPDGMETSNMRLIAASKRYLCVISGNIEGISFQGALCHYQFQAWVYDCVATEWHTTTYPSGNIATTGGLELVYVRLQATIYGQYMVADAFGGKKISIWKVGRLFSR